MSNTPTPNFHLELNKSVEEPQLKKTLKSFINKIKEDFREKQKGEKGGFITNNIMKSLGPEPYMTTMHSDDIQKDYNFMNRHYTKL